MELEILVQESMEKVGKLLPEAERGQFLELPEWELWRYDIGFGTMIRLRLLGARSFLRFKFELEGITDPEEMTRILILEYHRWMLDQSEKRGKTPRLQSVMDGAQKRKKPAI